MTPSKSPKRPTRFEADEEDQAAYDLCAGIYGECDCVTHNRAPCPSIMELSENGVTAEQERERIANGEMNDEEA